MALLHRLIGRKEVEARWGDVQSGLLFERTRAEPAAIGETSCITRRTGGRLSWLSAALGGIGHTWQSMVTGSRQVTVFYVLDK